MAKIKIAHILHSVGGVDVSLRLIVENVNPELFENIIIHGKDDTTKPFLNKNKQIIKEFSTPIFREISITKDLKAIYQTYRILKKEQPNIIHAHSAKGGVIGRIVGKLLNINVLYTPQAFSYLSSESKIKKKMYLAIEKLFAFKNSYILASSNSEKERAIKEVNYPKQRVLLFNNCITPILEVKSNNLNLPDDYICTVGRPSYQKNIELMIKIFKEVRKEKNISLVIMGVGHHSDKLTSVQELIHKLGLQDSVILLEWTSRESIFSIIKNSKLYISTARYEGLPYSVIESLALGKPVIVTDSDGNRDLVIDGYNGFVIKNENCIEFKKRIVEVLDSEKLNNYFSENSLKLFNDKFNINSNIESLEKIYLSSIK